MLRTCLIAAALILAGTQAASAQELLVRHASQLLGLAGYRDSGLADPGLGDTPPDGTIGGLLALPSLEAKLILFPDADESLVLEAQGAVRADALAAGVFTDSDTYDASIAVYRLWLRALYRQGELRLGLQQLNFGTARLLRPLRWFDTLDPNDPLQLSNGVKALLLRYSTAESATFWLWGMIDNDELKGVELLTADGRRPEVGGRAGAPLLGGDLAVTFHHRSIRDQLDPADPTLVTTGHEERLALDGAWDLGIGLWTEGYVGRVALEGGITLWNMQAAVGLDYTFEFGVHVLAEHLTGVFELPAPDENTTFNVTAAVADYNLNLVDQLSAMAFYAWEGSDISLIAAWLRTYDNWRIQMIGFILPTRDPLSADVGRRDRVVGFSGRGIELRVTFDYDIVFGG